MVQISKDTGRTWVRMACAGTVLLSLAGCGGTEEIARTIGLTRDVPDEFTVTTRAPLSMPPDFSIRPPQPGATRPQERSASASAEAALAPQSALASANTTQTPGERALISAAGPTAPSTIRSDVNKEASLDTPNRALTDRLMFWKAPPEPGVVVDPTREAKRLRENAALGQSAEAGDTAIIQRKSSGSGLLGGLF